MAFTSNRRTALRGAALLGAGFLGGSQLPGPGPLRTAGQDGPLSIVLLDEHAERLEPLIEAYSEEGVEVDVTPLGYSELYSQLSLALTQRAATFDVVSLDDPWIPQFASFLTPLDRSSEAASEVIPIANELARYPSDAAACGFPWLGDAQFFVTRPKWLEQFEESEPASWDETVDVTSSISASLESNEELAAFALSTLDPHAVLDSFLPILRGFGKDLIDPETNIPQLDTPEALGAIGIFQQLASASPAESAATGEATNVERFESGDVVMMSNFWSSDLLKATGVEAGRSAGPIDCALQPAQTGIERRSMPGVWIAGIPIGSERPEQARAFLDWLVSPKTQLALIEVAMPPVHAPVYADDAAIDRQPHLPQLLDLLAGSTPRPRSPFYPQLELLLAAELERLLNSDVSGEEAMRAANMAMREFLVREGVLDA